MKTDYFSTHVMHVPGADPDRDAIAERLRSEGACIHPDPKMTGLMINWLSALKCALNDETPWTIVTSDDVEPLGNDYVKHIELACRYSPSPFLSLTHLGSYGEKALQKNSPYGVGKYLTWGAVIAFKRNAVKPLYDWAKEVYELTGYKHDDVLVSAFALRFGIPTAMTARAIFGLPVKKSLIGHSMSGIDPKTTIINSNGPAYSFNIEPARVSRYCDPKGELERLAALP